MEAKISVGVIWIAVVAIIFVLSSNISILCIDYIDRPGRCGLWLLGYPIEGYEHFVIPIVGGLVATYIILRKKKSKKKRQRKR